MSFYVCLCFFWHHQNVMFTLKWTWTVKVDCCIVSDSQLICLQSGSNQLVSLNITSFVQVMQLKILISGIFTSRYHKIRALNLKWYKSINALVKDNWQTLPLCITVARTFYFSLLFGTENPIWRKAKHFLVFSFRKALFRLWWQEQKICILVISERSFSKAILNTSPVTVVLHEKWRIEYENSSTVVRDWDNNEIIPRQEVLYQNRKLFFSWMEPALFSWIFFFHPTLSQHRCKTF